MVSWWHCMVAQNLTVLFLFIITLFFFFTDLLHCWLNLQPITVPLLYFKYVYIHISLCILLMWIWTANWVLYSLIPVATGFSVQLFCNVLQPFLPFLKHDTTSDEARFKFHFFVHACHFFLISNIQRKFLKRSSESLEIYWSRLVSNITGKSASAKYIEINVSSRLCVSKGSVDACCASFHFDFI